MGNPYRAGKRRWTAFHLVAVLIFAVAGVVCFTLIFAPEKPEAPPPSTISYEAKPEAPPHGETDGSPGPAPRAVAKETKNPPPAADKLTCAIFGTITDNDTGQPIEGAAVVCKEPGANEDAKAQNRNNGRRFQRLGGPPPAASDEKPSRRYRTVSDKAGAYRLEAARPGHYVLRVVKEGYVPVKDQACEIQENRRELELNFTLAHGARITGKVTESGTGKPAAGVAIRAENVPFSAKTGADGRYTLAGLAPGTYGVSLDLQKAAYIATGSVPTRSVSITSPSQEVRGVDFVVEVAGQVWGYVLNKKKEAIANCDVVLCSSNSIFQQAMDASIRKAPPKTGRANGEGYYEINGVPLNKEWHLYATTESSAPQLSDAFILTPKQRVARLDLFLVDGSSVYGRVVTQDRKPVPDADVMCIPSYTKLFAAFETPQAFRPVKSEADGTFAVLHLPPGEYQILARKKGFKFAATGEPVYPNGVTDITNVLIVLAESGSEGSGSVYGRVTNAQGVPVAGATVALLAMGMEDFEPSNKSVQTDAQGNYVFESVAPGLLRLMVRKDGYENKDVPDVNLDEPTDVVLEGYATVNGIVLVKETQEPAASFTVNAISSSDASVTTVGSMLGQASALSTSGDGKFSIQLPPGEYTLEARASGLTPGRASVSVSSGDFSGSVTIYVSQSGARLAGRVSTFDGRSPQGAYVWITGGGIAAGGGGGPLGGALPLNMGAQRPDSAVPVSEDGSFQFSNLTGGTYTVFAQMDGYAQAQSGPINVAENQTVPGINIVLKLGNALEGTVTFFSQLEPNAIVVVTGNGVNVPTNTDENGYYQVEKLSPGAYLVSAISLRFPTGILPFSLLHARADIIEGQTTECNLGQPTNTALVGTSPPLPTGTIGYAILHLGVQPDILGMNLMNLQSNAAGYATDIASYVMGLSLIAPDGSFRIDNLVGGQYYLDIFEGSLGGATSGRVNHAYGPAPMVIQDGQVTPVNIQTLNAAPITGLPTTGTL